jgi:2-keto-4-pentenoate hydratase
MAAEPTLTTAPATTDPTVRSDVRRAADRLIEAAQRRVPCLPVRDLLAGADVTTAYGVQQLLVRHALAEGRRISGRKVGLTSKAVQAQLGVDQPDFGVLFEDMACGGDALVAMSRLLQPRIEAEVAFVLGADLDGPISPASARAAVSSAVAALEIVDSRIAGWDITLVDTIADNASCGLYVLGATPVPLGPLDLRDVAMTMRDGSGAVVSSGTGAACLGDPVLALTWLARTAQDLGSPLRAGEVVLSGALGPMVAVVEGSSFTAELTGLGSVRATFSRATDEVGSSTGGDER